MRTETFEVVRRLGADPEGCRHDHRRRVGGLNRAGARLPRRAALQRARDERIERLHPALSKHVERRTCADQKSDDPTARSAAPLAAREFARRVAVRKRCAGIELRCKLAALRSLIRFARRSPAHRRERQSDRGRELPLRALSGGRGARTTQTSTRSGARIAFAAWPAQSTDRLCARSAPAKWDDFTGGLGCCEARPPAGTRRSRRATTAQLAASPATVDHNTCVLPRTVRYPLPAAARNSIRCHRGRIALRRRA